MKKWIVSAVGFCAGTALVLGQTTTTAPKPQPQQTVSPAAAQRAFLNQNCVGCHNTRSPLPASQPINLEKADLDNVLADADTWERVLRKLSVRAMPPPSSPRPSEADYVAFTTSLANS